MNTFNTTSTLPTLYHAPITFDYTKPSESQLAELKQNQAPCEFQPSEKIKIENAYYKAGLAGTAKMVYSRKIIVEKIQHLATLLPDDTGFIIFDAFRSTETQTVLFQQFQQQLHALHPDLNEVELEKLTRKFVAHPTDPGHYKIPLHNSGGAIDLAIINLSTQKMWDFGTDFDAPIDASATAFFERDPHPDDETNLNITPSRWKTIQENRRILFHLMKQAGFVNYPNEWWHYDLGDCNWANILGIPYIYHSLENKIP